RFRTPVCVAVEGHVQLAPVASEQGPAVPDHDVALEAKALVRLDPRALDLRVAAKGEDVVAHHVLLAVVLVAAAVGRSADHVVLSEDVGGSLVEVDTPASVLHTAHLLESASSN